MQAKTVKTVRVFRSGDYIGDLSRTEFGSRFAYVEGVHKPLCFAMPTSQKVYEQAGDNLLPYFANLLPEGRRLNVIARQAKVSVDDLFSLLLQLGEELIGDIHIEPIVNPREVPDLESTSLDFRKLMEFNQDFAGVQDKLSVRNQRRAVRSTTGLGIMKFASGQYPRLIHNEYFFMELARKAKFDVPAVNVVTDRHGEEALFVQRFDRAKNSPSKGIVMLHQEDGCQILSIFPSGKYNVQFQKLIDVMGEFCASKPKFLMDAFRLYIFSYLIGNGDLHAKNLSILESHASGLFGISPVYDMLSTLPYDLDQKMALQLYGKDNGFSLRGFLDAAKRLGLPEKMVEAETRRLAEVIGKEVVNFGQIGLTESQEKKMVLEIGKRLDRLHL